VDQWLRYVQGSFEVDRWRGYKSLGWTGGLDKSKVALDVRPHWRCGQVDYTKNFMVHGWKVPCIGELITPIG
jgi:hypothetical protein